MNELPQNTWKRGDYLSLTPNGDPFGCGFTATELQNRNDHIGVHRGDIGVRSRQWWRSYARIHGYKLIEAR